MIKKHLKVKKIIKNGKILEIWVKGNYKKLRPQFNLNFRDDCMSYLEPYIDFNQKYTILQFILRNREDIEPYLDSNIEKVLSKLTKQKEVLDKIKEYIKENACYDKDIKQCCRDLLTNECDYILELLEEIE